MMHLHNPFEDRKEGRQRNLFGIGGTGGGLSLDIGGSDPLGQAFSTVFGSPSGRSSQDRVQEFAPTETATNISQLLQEIFGGTGAIPGQIGGQIGQTPGQVGGFDLGGFQQGAIGQQLQGELTQPSFGVNQAEQSLLDQIMSQTQGGSAVRGLGPSTQGSLAQAIAPALTGFRQDRISNLLGGAGLEAQTGLGARGQDLGSLLGQFQGGIQQRGQDIGARGQDLSALLQQLGLGTQGLGLAAQLMQPERITLGSSQQTGGSPGLFSQLFPGGLTGGGSFLSRRGFGTG